ncbi:MAG TPA: PIN domain-containing protein [Candidatus Acidoferrales bacterium]|nr:PIN domain-containing protein [Candidatus Acidoferrales bacterium]
MSRIFWDTNLFIYLFEGHGPFSERTSQLRRTMLARGDQLLTSTLTLGEVLVKPIERGDANLAFRYEQAISRTAILIPLDARAARLYASLRCERALRPPDAIQLACAATVGVDLFITNDAKLQSRQIEGIQFVVSLDRAPI